jgi:hypothetical protein
MSKRIIPTADVNRKWAPREIANLYGELTVKLEIGWNDESPEFNPDDVARFVAQMAVHSGVLQANDPQAELPWAMSIKWRQGKLHGAGLLKLDRLWNPDNVRLGRFDQMPKAEPEGYTFLNMAKLELTKMLKAGDLRPDTPCSGRV